MIEVRRVAEGDPMDFEVVIREGEGETRHHVTMSRQMCDRLAAGKHTPERCLEAAFRFLLARPRAEGVNPPTLRRDGNLALLPRIRVFSSRHVTLRLMHRPRRPQSKKKIAIIMVSHSRYKSPPLPAPVSQFPHQASPESAPAIPAADLPLTTNSMRSQQTFHSM